MTGDSFRTISSGVDGLDEVLGGGLLAGRMYLVSGDPGVGKTLMGAQFLEAGLENDESALFIHGEETREELCLSAAAIGIDIQDAEFLDLGPDSEFFVEDRAYSLVDPSAVEQTKYTEKIHEAVRKRDPDRLVLDPITQLRYVQPNEAQFRRQLLSFFRFLKGNRITVLTTITPSTEHTFTKEVRSLSDGIIEPYRTANNRRLRVGKHRTVGQLNGNHGMRINEDGLAVFPSLVPEKHDQDITGTPLRTGVPELDTQLGGGLERNTTTFISGPTGAGKTTLGARILTEAAEAGLQACLYLFEESVSSLLNRCDALGIPLEAHAATDTLELKPIEPLSFSPEEFACVVRSNIEAQNHDVVMIDGIEGYTKAIRGEQDDLVERLHALTRHLTNNGVSVVLTDEVSDIVGLSAATSTDAGYIADNVVFLGYAELYSSLRTVIGVLKKRTGDYERTFREFELTGTGIEVGNPLMNVTGILSGLPREDDPEERGV